MLDHLSYSSISSYLMCPRAWKFHYLDKVPAPTSPALLFGSAFHNALEGYIKDRDSLPLTERWLQAWQEQTERDQEVNWGDDTPEALANLGVRMFGDSDVRDLVNSLTPLSPEHVEQYIELQVPGVPIPIIGYIDMVEEDGVPCDFKTSSRSWYQSKADDELQAGFYLAALNQLGTPSSGNLFRYYVFTKTKTPKAQIWETTRSNAELLWLFGLIREVWEAIQAEHFPPNPTTWKCSAKWCEYWSICRGRV